MIPLRVPGVRFRNGTSIRPCRYRETQGARSRPGRLANEVIGADVRRKRIVWRYPSAFPFYSSAAVAGDRLVVGGRDKKVHCLNLKTGKAIWTFATRARVDSSPA